MPGGNSPSRELVPFSAPSIHPLGAAAGAAGAGAALCSMPGSFPVSILVESSSAQLPACASLAFPKPQPFPRLAALPGPDPAGSGAEDPARGRSSPGPGRALVRSGPATVVRQVSAGAGNCCRVTSSGLGSRAVLRALPHVSLRCRRIRSCSRARAPVEGDPLLSEQLVVEGREIRLSLPFCCCLGAIGDPLKGVEASCESDIGRLILILCPFHPN